MEYLDTLAAILVSGVVLVIAASVIVLTIRIPPVLVASGLVVMYCIALVDSQVEYFDTVASSSTPIV